LLTVGTVVGLAVFVNNRFILGFGRLVGVLIGTLRAFPPVGIVTTLFLLITTLCFARPVAVASRAGFAFASAGAAGI
jgi:hypothetical protein